MPTLVIDGKPYFESAALLMILAERHPEAKLAPPPDSDLRVDWYQWIAFCTTSPRTPGYSRMRRHRPDRQRRYSAPPSSTT